MASWHRMTRFCSVLVSRPWHQLVQSRTFYAGICNHRLQQVRNGSWCWGMGAVSDQLVLGLHHDFWERVNRRRYASKYRGNSLLYWPDDTQPDFVQVHVWVYLNTLYKILLPAWTEQGFELISPFLRRYVTGEVSTIVMKADEEIVEARSKLESVETLLQDERIVPELRQEIRQHFQASKSNSSVDMAALFRCVCVCCLYIYIYIYIYNIKSRQVYYLLRKAVLNLRSRTCIFSSLLFCSRVSHSLQVEIASFVSRYVRRVPLTPWWNIFLENFIMAGNIWTTCHYFRDAKKSF